MAAYEIGQVIIFLPCGFFVLLLYGRPAQQMRTLYFYPVSFLGFFLA